MSDIGQNARSSGIINTTMQGQVFKIHSDFYYVKSDNEDLILECKLREVLKKQKLKIKVGDFVETDKGGAIKKLLKRKNTLERPCVSNLDMVAVVSSLMEPDIDYIQLNRYLIFSNPYRSDGANRLLFIYFRIDLNICRATGRFSRSV